MSEWLKNTCYPLYLMCCCAWNPLVAEFEINEIKKAAKAARLAKKPRITLGESGGVVPYDVSIPLGIVQQWADINKVEVKIKKPKQRIRYNLGKDKYDQLITFRLHPPFGITVGWRPPPVMSSKCIYAP